MDRFTFQFNGKTYTDCSPRSHHCEPATHFVPDEVREVSFNAGVDDDTGDTAMNVETSTNKSKVKAASKAKARGANTSTKFSDTKANKIDGVRARRALRAAGMRAPYDPTSKKVQDVLATL